MLSTGYGFETYSYLGVWAERNALLEDQQKRLRYYEENAATQSVPQMAKALGVDEPRVYAENRRYLSGVFNPWTRQIISQAVFDRVEAAGHPVSKRDNLSDLAKNLFEAGKPDEEIARLLGVGQQALDFHMHAKGIRLRSETWTSSEEQSLKRYIESTGSGPRMWQVIADELGRTVASCQAKANSKGWIVGNTRSASSDIPAPGKPGKNLKKSGIYDQEQLSSYLQKKFEKLVKGEGTEYSFSDLVSEVATELGIEQSSAQNLLRRMGLTGGLDSQMLANQNRKQKKISAIRSKKTKKTRPDGKSVPDIPSRSSKEFQNNKQVCLDMIFQATLDHFEYQIKQDKEERGITDEKLYFPSSKTSFVKFSGSEATQWVGLSKGVLWETKKSIFSSYAEFLSGFFTYAEAVAKDKNHPQQKAASWVSPFRLKKRQHSALAETYGKDLHTRALPGEQKKIISIVLELFSNLANETEGVIQTEAKVMNRVNLAERLGINRDTLRGTRVSEYGLGTADLIERIEHARKETKEGLRPKLKFFNWLAHFENKVRTEESAQRINKAFQNDRKKMQKTFAMRSAEFAVKNATYIEHNNFKKEFGISYEKLTRAGLYKSKKSTQYIFESKDHYFKATAEAAKILAKKLLEKENAKNNLAIQRLEALGSYLEFKIENPKSSRTFNYHLKQNGISADPASLSPETIKCIDECTCLQYKASGS